MTRKLTIVSRLSALALRPFLGDGADNLVNAVFSHIADHGSKVSIALEQAQHRAWRSLEVALAGDSWWGKCKSVLTAGDERAFRKQVQQFIAAVPLENLPPPTEDFRRGCLQELREARKAGLLPGDRLSPDELPKQARTLLAYTDPDSLLGAEWQAVEMIAADLRASGYPQLAHFVTIRPAQGLPLLVVATRFFFRREVESDAELSRGLTYQQLDRLTREQEEGFRGINETLAQHGQRVEQLLADVKEIVAETYTEVREVREIVQGSQDDVRALRAQMEEQGRQMHELFGALQAAMAQLRLPAAAPPPVPIASAVAERQQVEQLLEQCKALPSEEQAKAASVVKIARQLESAAKSYDASRKLVFPFLSDPPPVRPAIAPKPPVPKPPAEPGEPARLKQIRGPLVNESLFGAPEPPAEEEPPPDPPSPGTSKGRIVSPLFRPKSDGQ